MINETQKYEDKGVGFISNKDNADYKQLKWELNRFNDNKSNKFRKVKKNLKGSSKSFKKPSNGKKGKLPVGKNKSKKNFHKK